MASEQSNSGFSALDCFISYGNDLTRTEGAAAFGIVEDMLDTAMERESPEQTAHCIGYISLELNLDKLL